jgi:hypothetical protein
VNKALHNVLKTGLLALTLGSVLTIFADRVEAFLPALRWILAGRSVR